MNTETDAQRHWRELTYLVPLFLVLLLTPLATCMEVVAAENHHSFAQCFYAFYTWQVMLILGATSLLTLKFYLFDD